MRNHNCLRGAAVQNNVPSSLDSCLIPDDEGLCHCGSAIKKPTFVPPDQKAALAAESRHRGLSHPCSLIQMLKVLAVCRQPGNAVARLRLSMNPVFVCWCMKSFGFKAISPTSALGLLFCADHRGGERELFFSPLSSSSSSFFFNVIQQYLVREELDCKHHPKRACSHPVSFSFFFFLNPH